MTHVSGNDSDDTSNESPKKASRTGVRDVESRDSEVEKLVKQYGQLVHLVQEQTRIGGQQAHNLQQELVKQTEVHKKELRRLEQAWSHRLDTVIESAGRISPNTLSNTMQTGNENDSTSVVINQSPGQKFSLPLFSENVTTISTSLSDPKDSDSSLSSKEDQTMPIHTNYIIDKELATKIDDIFAQIVFIDTQIQARQAVSKQIGEDTDSMLAKLVEPSQPL